MTPTPKETIRARLKEKGMTQAQLAEHIGTTPAILSRTLGSPPVRPDSHWPAVLEALGLEVQLVPKGQ
ncbi:helix-turn-helix transcriptional regulator [Deinococcus sp. NW-56]|uniref:helix-turn-helix transcriptional regulator n=1 Tax=Deinococcus sp. NW-56 TaxID=2080419 RepID=UPI000CF52FFE|nr:helix-turn-helix transcriptional regulator [Deinococcus sp. NW-56]